MANIVNLDRVSKGYPTAGLLLEQVSAGIDEADRIGVVGLNGTGKSTLLQLIGKLGEPDAGRVTHRRGLRVATLPQAITFAPEATVRDVVLGAAWLEQSFGAEHEWAADAGIRTVLTGLGMPDLGLDAGVASMSGGERRRVALAALLVREADLLVLDEPTNHLDVGGINWLAGHLLNRRGAVVVVTHDRWFLDAVCTRTWEVADRSVRSYEGGYAAWVLARAERARLEAAAETRRQNLLRKEIAWLRRGPPARTSKPKFRIEAANALIADVPAPRDPVSLHRLAVSRLGKQVYELSGVSVAVAGGRHLFDRIDWLVGPGDRIGIVGANGAGKSTLLRLLAGAREPDEGAVTIGATVRAAFLTQELPSRHGTGPESPGSAAATGPDPAAAGLVGLSGQVRVLEAVEQVTRRVRLGDRELSAAQFAELFGFGDQAGTGSGRGGLRTRVDDLSGGERRRLQLLRLLAGEPNVLLLDEPTNDLDTDTLASLEDLLDSWPGTLIVASHDRYLIERVCDTVFAIYGDGRLTHLPGGIDEYLASLDTASRADALPGISTHPVGGGQDGQGGAGGSPARAGELRAVKKELARLERQLDKLGQREAVLHEQLARHATDYEKVAALDADLRAAQAERDRTEEAWLDLAGRLEER